MPQRIGSPFMFGQAVLEPIVQPIYDRVTILAGATGNNRFFITTAAKTERDIFPQLTTGGQLSAPKLAVVYGHRVIFSENVAIDTNILPDLKLLLYNSFYRFHVGIKDYLVVPTFMVPGGVGIAGFAGVDGAAALAQFQTATSGVPAFHSHMSVEKRKVAIPPQQQFFSDVNVSVGIVTASNRDVWVSIDCEFGQEVQ